ncbi:hypothetical protein F4778DRAFT_775869 [Xylariomycetidae sp. FL2044]|nr:hypothetical protein F4778DRAFT_775869 [Xylariomycetidae sp. FL2044]
MQSYQRADPPSPKGKERATWSTSSQPLAFPLKKSIRRHPLTQSTFTKPQTSLNKSETVGKIKAPGDTNHERHGSTTTWTSSSADIGLLSETEDADDRQHLVNEYNRLAEKHGIRLLMPGDFPTTTTIIITAKSTNISIDIGIDIAGTAAVALAQPLIQEVDTRGIFRVSGSVRVVNALYDYYCAGRDADDISSTTRCPTLPTHIKYNVHDIASTFKRLLAGLPGGILGSLALFDGLVAIHSQLHGDAENTKTRVTKLRARLIALAIGTVQSRYQRHLICAVFGLLSLVGRKAETTPREDDEGRPLPTGDLMGYNALGIIFGPLLIGDLINAYSMKLADPSAGLVLLPATPPRSRKRKHKKCKSHPKPMPTALTVDKTHVANNVTEMVLLHWREVVRHMRDSSCIKTRQDTETGLRTHDSILKSSASDTFSLRKPPDWEDYGPSTRGGDRRPSLAGKSVLADTPDSLPMKRQRSRPSSSSSSHKLPLKNSVQTLSPTMEESPSQGSYTGKVDISSGRGPIIAVNPTVHKELATDHPRGARPRSQGVSEDGLSPETRKNHTIANVPIRGSLVSGSNEGTPGVRKPRASPKRRSSSPGDMDTALRSSPQFGSHSAHQEMDAPFGPAPEDIDHDVARVYNSSAGRTPLKHDHQTKSQRKSKGPLQSNENDRDYFASSLRETKGTKSPSLRTYENFKSYSDENSPTPTPSPLRGDGVSAQGQTIEVPDHTKEGTGRTESLAHITPVTSTEMNKVAVRGQRTPSEECKPPSASAPSPLPPPSPPPLPLPPFVGREQKTPSRECKPSPPSITPKKDPSALTETPHLIEKVTNQKDAIPNINFIPSTSRIKKPNALSQTDTVSMGSLRRTKEKKKYLAVSQSYDSIQQTGAPSSGDEERSAPDQKRYMLTRRNEMTREPNSPPPEKTRPHEEPFATKTTRRPAASENQSISSCGSQLSSNPSTFKSSGGAVKAIAARFDTSAKNSPAGQETILTGRTRGTTASQSTKDSSLKSLKLAGVSTESLQLDTIKPHKGRNREISTLLKTPIPSFSQNNLRQTSSRAFSDEKPAELKAVTLRPNLTTRTTSKEHGVSSSQMCERDGELRQPPSLGMMVSHPEEPPVAQHINFFRPPSSTSLHRPIQDTGEEIFWGQGDGSPIRRPSPSRPVSSGSNSLLYAYVRQLQRQLGARTEEAAHLRRQLDARENMDVGTLSEQLRKTTRECKMWRDRAEAAERRVAVFERFIARVRGLREIADREMGVGGSDLEEDDEDKGDEEGMSHADFEESSSSCAEHGTTDPEVLKKRTKGSGSRIHLNKNKNNNNKKKKNAGGDGTGDDDGVSIVWRGEGTTGRTEELWAAAEELIQLEEDLRRWEEVDLREEDDDEGQM